MRPFPAVAFLMFVSVQASAQRDINWDAVHVTTQKLDDNVYVLQFMGPDGPAGNVGGNSVHSLVRMASRLSIPDTHPPLPNSKRH